MLCHFSVHPMNANVLNPIGNGDDEEKYGDFRPAKRPKSNTVLVKCVTGCLIHILTYTSLLYKVFKCY